MEGPVRHVEAAPFVAWGWKSDSDGRWVEIFLLTELAMLNDFDFEVGFGHIGLGRGKPNASGHV